MFAFAKQLVKSTAEGIIQNASAAYEGNVNTGVNPRSQQSGRSEPTHGFRILHVFSNSPASEAGLEPLFDFIVGINGHDIVGGTAFNPYVPPHKSYQSSQYQPQYQQQDYQNQPSPAQGYFPNQPNQPSQYTPATSPGNPYAPPTAQDSSQQFGHQRAPSGVAPPLRGHGHRGSISHASAAIVIPQLSPPQAEIAPIQPFLQEISNCRGRSVSFDVWSSKGRIRKSIIVPVPSTPPGSKSSSQTDLANIAENALENSPELTLGSGLGLSLQWTPLSVADHVWHVLNVSPNSPAEEAGLISHSDYIVGAEGGLLEQGGEDLLGRVISRLVSNHLTARMVQENQLKNQKQLNEITEENEDEISDEKKALEESRLEAEKNAAALFQRDDSRSIVNSHPELELYVYNHDYNTLRPVRIRPNNKWGGSGLLGCGVGYGLLHRLPAISSMTYADSNSNPPPSSQSQYQGSPENQFGSYEYPPPSGAPLPPGGTLFDSSVGGAPGGYDPSSSEPGQMFIPAASAGSISSPPPPPTFGGPAPPVSSVGAEAVSHGLVPAIPRKKRHHHYPGGPETGAVDEKKLENDLAAYFAEEEERGRELEGPARSSGNTPVDNIPPPPPNAS